QWPQHQEQQNLPLTHSPFPLLPPHSHHNSRRPPPPPLPLLPRWPLLLPLRLRESSCQPSRPLQPLIPPLRVRSHRHCHSLPSPLQLLQPLLLATWMGWLW
ncbi:unnamed protein product, partial [Closterium sp. NIES-54]